VTAYLSTHEVAAYLGIGERKIYELLRQRRIPASRVAGKWLFPRALIDLWVLQGAEGTRGLPAPGAPPPVIAGSHDPLLEWAVRESGCGLALMFDGSLDGLARLGAGQALVCGMHVPGPDDEWNLHEVSRVVLPSAVVVIEWSWRQQGLIVARGNPAGITGVADLERKDTRVIGRQPGAGSRVLLESLLAAEGISVDALTFVEPPARSESDVALAVLSGVADTGLGIGATVTGVNLDFVPLARERYDLVIARRDYFEPAFQTLLEFTRQTRFESRARELGGYDVAGCGAVRWNSPAP